MNDTDYEKIRLRYRFAFEVYRDLVAMNALSGSTSDEPSAEQLRQEQQALDDLVVARRALLDALTMRIPPAIH